MGVFVGIEVSKEKVHWAAWTPEKPDAFQQGDVPYTPKGIQSLEKTLKSLNPLLTVVEASGGLERTVWEELEAAGFTVSVVNPRRVRYFAKALGQEAKTDPLDAQVLARFAAAICPSPTPVPPETLRRLKALMTRRDQIVGMIQRERQHLATAPDFLKPDIKLHLEQLKEQLRNIEEEIKELVTAQPKWQSQVQLLTSMPGVGWWTAVAIIAWLPELGKVSGREATALAGLAPYNWDSGKRKGERHIFGGRKRLRRILYMAAQAATIWNEELREFYERLRGRGKATKVAMVAVARKMVVILNAMMRDGTYWQSSKAVPQAVM